jgi:short-subunit dehydrogenase
LFEKLQKKDVGVLVNNVGVFAMGPFTEISSEKLKQLISVNCFSMAMMSNHFAKNMLNRE